MPTNGIVFNIQRFTINDGPGLRTELFLKGCPLRCLWCSNPEGLMPMIQTGVYRTKCISRRKCGACEEVCPQEGALNFYRGKIAAVDRSLCKSCLACVKACPSEAIKQWGVSMSVEECMEEIRKDRGYYERSGGGVTVSGGEPLLQSEFVAELFHACKKEGIQTCLESTFYAPWERIEAVLPVTDVIISDLKFMSGELHQKYTGVHNEKILRNLKRLTDEGRKLILRIPVIPGINDHEENMEATAEFILHELQNRVSVLQLLSYMRLGEEKYASLGIPYPMERLKFNRKSFQKRVSGFAEYFNQKGIHCIVGTNEKESQST